MMHYITKAYIDAQDKKTQKIQQNDTAETISANNISIRFVN